MIAYIEGRLAETTENSCVVISASGVGYEVHLPIPLLAAAPPRGGEVHFFVCTVVREDAFELFGFSSWDERQTFVILRSINRVGARTALAILSVFSPDELRQITATDDVLALTRVPGIGKKTGQQIFLELKYKLTQTTPSGIALSPSLSQASQVMNDAINGLMNLGYSEQDAHAAVKAALEGESDMDVGETLRKALKILARGQR